MKIYKYALPSKKGTFEIKMPRLHKVLHVATVKNMFPYFWAIVLDEWEEVTYEIHALHTGDKPVNSEFLGTVVLDDGDYVLHYFIEKKKEP